MRRHRAPLPPYDSAPRRRVRSILRVYQHAGRPVFYGRRPIVTAYWWDGTPNFGDALTPWLLPRYGLIPVHVPGERAGMAGVGSILELLPSSFGGAVWGSGLLHGAAVDLPHARFVAVRGALTRNAQGLDPATPLGDPGLLVSRHLPARPTRWRLGIVAHHFHTDAPEVVGLAAGREEDVTVIDVTRRPDHVVRQISSCAAVLTTSLHGLVVADSYGIPAVWGVAEPALWGAEFKFHDYESAVRPTRERRLRLTSSTTIDDVLGAVASIDLRHGAHVMDGLEDALSGVPSRPGFPALAWRYR